MPLLMRLIFQEIGVKMLSQFEYIIDCENFNRTNVRTHVCCGYVKDISEEKGMILTFMGFKSLEACLSNDIVPIDDNVNSNYK